MTEPTATEDAAPTGKGRPTPKRSDARKQRRAATPRNRKEAAALRREKAREQRTAQRKALQTGDERFLPARDAGPAKRHARDYVDSRFTLGQIFFGMILVVLVLSLVPIRAVAIIVNVVMLALFFGVIFSSVHVGRRARREVEAKFGEKHGVGITSYVAMRAMQPRRMRRPPPRVSRKDAKS